MKQPRIPFYYEGEIEEIVLPDNNADKKTALISNISNETNEKTAVAEAVKDSQAAQTGDAQAQMSKDDMLTVLTRTLSGYGEFFCRVAAASIIFPFKVLIYIAKFLWKHTVLFRNAVVTIFKAFIKFIAAPFIKNSKRLASTRARIKQAKAAGEERTVIRLYAKLIKEVLFGRRGVAVTLFNYATPVIALVFLMGVVGYATNTDYAIRLSVNGKFMGYIRNEQVYNDAERILQERITYMGGEQAVAMEPAYSLEMLGDQPYLTKYQLANKMMEISDEPIEYGFGMYIGNKFYGALTDTAAVQAKLQEILDSYRTGSSEDEEVAFEKEITYVPGLYLSANIVSSEEIISLITSKKIEAAYYTIVDGDSHSLICDKLDISMDELAALNPGIMDEDYVLRAGDKLLKNHEVPFLSVSISRTEVYDVDVPYDTEYTSDDEHYEGVETVLQQGEYGTNRITAKVYYVNGEETGRDIITTERTKDPVTEIISLGTLPPQSSHFSDEQVDYDMKYIWPVNGGSFWEWGWWDGGYSGHTGVDIGAPYGTDIYAGASGVVSFAGWNWGGYGYCVMIDHPDGYTTVYAHCSDLFVSEGQQVVQGQCIAAMGETGYAFGVHLHFEVRYGAERLNPRYYMNGLQDLYNYGY